MGHIGLMVISLTVCAGLAAIPTSARAEEQRCAEMGAACICSEPLNTNSLPIAGSDWQNPADSTVKECTNLNDSTAYRGYALERPAKDLFGSNDPAVLSRLPSGHGVRYFTRAPAAHRGMWTVGHAPGAPDGYNRVAARFYIYRSSDFQFAQEGTCGNAKFAQFDGSLLDSSFGYVHMYNFLNFQPSRDCCMVGPGPQNLDKQDWRNNWWRVEIVLRNLSGPGFDTKVYMKNVTLNSPEITVIDLQYPTSEWTPTGTLTPPQRMHRIAANLFRSLGSNTSGECLGWQGISHYMYAAWATDNGQRIGGAYEIEGGGASVPAPTPAPAPAPAPAPTPMPSPSPSVDTTPPPAPGSPQISLTGTGSSNATFSASWLASIDQPSNTPVPGYRYITAYNDGSGQKSGSSSTNGLSFTMPYHSSGQAQPAYFCVTAVDAAGNVSADSSCNAYTVPAPVPGPAPAPAPAPAPSPLPGGIASGYVGDVGIQSHPDVVFAENFETGTVNEIAARFSNAQNTAGMSLLNDVPAGSGGTRSIQMTSIGGQNDGGYLYKRLPTGLNQVYMRYYAKYSSGGTYHHSGGWIGGYNPATDWPQGGAGLRPTGYDLFSVGPEPVNSALRFDLYTYWMGMSGDGNGNYWGNHFIKNDGIALPADRWVAVEVMLKMNSPVTATNGELAAWLDGRKVLDLKPGATLDGATFPGFQWRATDALNINWIWIKHYATQDPSGYVGKLKYDHLVVAKSYIGPINTAAPVTDTTPPAVSILAPGNGTVIKRFVSSP
jgi:hypothetical protein